MIPPGIRAPVLKQASQKQKKVKGHVKTLQIEQTRPENLETDNPNPKSQT